MPFRNLANLKPLIGFADHGVHRILHTWRPAGTAIEENLERLKALIDYAGDRLIILPGAGIWHTRMPSQLPISLVSLNSTERKSLI